MKKPLERREKAKMAYDYASAEVKKLTEKPSKDPSKLPKAKDKFKSAKEVYEETNAEVKEQVHALNEKRPKVLDPIFKFVTSLSSHLINLIVC